MDGIHDLGGKSGFGPVENDKAPVGFAARWHAVVFSLVNVAYKHQAIRNTDHFRHAVERINPASYLSDGYYGRWLGGLETLFVEKGLVDQAEVTAKAVALGAADNARVAARPRIDTGQDDAIEQAERTSTARRTPDSQPLFAIGERVRAHSYPSIGHTRLPAYVRGAYGTIVEQHSSWVLPDAAAHGAERAEHLYSVRFDAASLFGDDVAEENCAVFIDLFESYLHTSPGREST